MSNQKLEQTIIDFITGLKTDSGKFTLGLSGGVDSVVLFHILSKYRIDFNAIYVHHGLSENADEWLEFCYNLCLEHNVDFHVKKVQVKKGNRESLEENARILRYQAYHEISKKESRTVILGHHNDDLIETMLLNLLNRSGSKGLGAMPASYFNENFKINIARPFLGDSNFPISKEMIESYAIDNDITHIYDESNEDNSFSRNFLRNDIIPKLKDHFGNIGKPMAKTNKEIQENQTVECDIFLRTEKNLDMYKIFINNHLNWKNLVFSFKKHFNESVKKINIDNFITWIYNRKSHENVFNLGKFTIFMHKEKPYVVKNETLEFLDLKVFNLTYLPKTDVLKINPDLKKSINNAFKKNDYIRKNIPPVFRNSAIYQLNEEGELLLIGNFNVNDRLAILKKSTGNPYVDYFLNIDF